MHKRRRAFFKLLLALALQLLCAHAAFAAGQSKLVIGYAATTARLMPLWIAQEHGFFAKNGLESQPVMLRGGTILVTALAAGDVQIGRTAGAAVLSAVSAGHDLKMLATYSSRNSYDAVVRPNIKRAEDLRGKRIAINTIGGGTWMGAMLWLEHFGLEPQRDQIHFQSIGDQGVQAQALESGTVDVAFVDGVYSKWLKQKGMHILAEFSEMKQPLVSQSTVVPRQFLQQHPDAVENYLKSEIEGLAFALGPKNKPAVIRTLMKRLRTDAAGAEDGYVDLVRGIDRRPLPSYDGLRNLQRLLKPRNAKIGELRIDEVIDSRIMRKLDESGFIDRAFAAQGASFKY